MGEFDSVDEVLEFAIAREIEANEFYKVLSGRVENPAMRELILEFAKEELEHKATLEMEVMKRGGVVTEVQRQAEARKLEDFTLADYIVDTGGWLYMDYVDILVLAMKKEKVSFRLYVDLAGLVSDKDTQEVLVSLAEEEARHKMRFELEYDEMVLKKKTKGQETE